ncbi:MAG: hydroxymethylglutaryl-CoA reductase [Kiritimatiellae bacterium]|nr:hydroxymethylglutaryl-CoA reductase [Kiritimatiellia bacterium]
MKDQARDGTLCASVPMQRVGPVLLHGPDLEGEVLLPLATYETPLWPSVNRGARVATQSGGLHVTINDDRMTRSILLEAPTAAEALRISRELLTRHRDTLRTAAEASSRFARFLDLHSQLAANLIFLRLEMQSGDASGHNMLTQAAEAMTSAILQLHPELRYVSLSGNYCTDKKVSAVNGILGRGKHVTAEALIPEKICARYLKTSARAVANLNVKKNLIGSLLAGGIRSANAHFANMLLAFYLATGQDAANIVEGSQGLTHAEDRDGSLYFSVTIPNIIVGTVGNGKELDFVRENLNLLGCLEERAPGANARRLAAAAAAAVWCGELSLMAALTNEGELMAAHKRLERKP